MAARAIDIPDDVIYVSGFSFNSSDVDYILIKIDLTLGDTVWTKRYNTSNNGDDVGTKCALDGSNIIYQVGNTKPTGPTGDNDFLIVKYNALNGDTIWTRRYDTQVDTSELDYCFDDCTVDAGGNIYVTGTCRYGTTSNMLTIKYTPTGDTAWVRQYGVANVGETSYGCAVTPSGELYVVGMAGAGGNNDVLAVKYNAVTRDTIWSVRYDDPGNRFEAAQGCVVDNAGDLYISGTIQNVSNNYDILAIKYHTGTGVAEGPGSPAREPSSLLTSNPNPFTGKTEIRFSRNMPVNYLPVRLGIFDVSGRMIKTFALDPSPATNQIFIWNGMDDRGLPVPSGVYFCALETTAGCFTRVLVKSK